jgi:hypothetical protein
MKMKKLAIIAGLSAAMGGGASSALAAIPGVPGEANLVPMVLNGNPDGVALQTYIGLYVPETIGEDTVISEYTALNAAPTTTDQSFDGQDAIYWELFDVNSKKIEDGECDASPGDVVIWSTDPLINQVQAQQTAELNLNPDSSRIPIPTCGPSNDFRIGYVTFQTNKGSKGEAADFAFSGYAAVVSNGVFGMGPSMASVPVFPMADGDDTIYPTLTFRNSIINQPPPGATGEPVIQAAPITSGMRMNNADGAFDEVWAEMPIQGIAAGSPRSVHVLWFDKNDENRSADLIVWDDMEGDCSDSIKLPRELNIWIWNQEFNNTGFGNIPRGWTNLSDPMKATPYVDKALTDLVEAVQPSDRTFGYQSREYCTPDYWEAGVAQAPIPYVGALFGNVTYKLDEENPSTVNNVDAAAAIFHWQESVLGGMAVPTSQTPDSGSYRWSSHPGTELGVMD